MNATAPLLVPLSATNPSSVVRMHGYALLPRNPLQTKVLPVCLPARCAQAGVRYAQAGVIITAIHE